MKPYYEKNPILNDDSVNVTFDQLLEMSMIEFDNWVIHSRKKILESWDTYGCPPRSGQSEQKIIDEFNKLTDAPVHLFKKDDELTPYERGTVIHNTLHSGTEVDQWFPNMMKVPMNYTSTNKGYSVYDMFKNDKYLPSMIKRSKRHFRKDSFYHYSLCIYKNDKESALINVDTGKKWCEIYFTNSENIFLEYNFWLSECEINEKVSSGYYQVKQSDFLSLTKNEVLELHKKYGFTNIHLANIDINNLKDNCLYLIRLFRKNQKIYPKGFTAYRIGYISVPINFPPMTAKYLYERFTDHLKGKNERILVFDPSSGWAGRILGAMSVKDDRIIHYIGTDPNPDNIHSDGISKYEHLANFFNTKTYRGISPFSHTNTYDIYDEGSEEIHNNLRFQQYKGKIDLIFTSPPYFSREAYSIDPKQSCVKYGASYEIWRDGFLIPTLKTCYEYLKPGGYLLWNIADVLVEMGYLPLEQDSVDCLKSLGMIQEPTLKMILASMPGSQRLDENGIPKCKNYCKVNNKYHKFEPIYIFRKV